MISLPILGSHLLVAVAMFFSINWLGRHSEMFGYESLTMFREAEDRVAFNALFRVATPIVFLTIVSAAFYTVGWDSLVRDIHYALYLYVVVRAAFILASGRRLLMPWARTLI